MSQGNRVHSLSGLQRLLEGGLIICSMLAIYILLALTSFSASDPGWSQSNYQGHIQNLGGAVGAWIADILYYFFGYSAFLAPFVVAGTGWLLFKQSHRLLEIDYFSVSMRLLGFILIVFGVSTLASMNGNDIYEFSAGGVTGDVIAAAMLPYFNQLGTTLLLLCSIATGFTLLTGISLIALVEMTGRGTTGLFVSLYHLPSKLAKSRETEDTKGFMSIAAGFKRKQSDALENEADADESTTVAKSQLDAVSEAQETDENTAKTEKPKRKFFFFGRKGNEPDQDDVFEDEDDEQDDLDIDTGSEQFDNKAKGQTRVEPAFGAPVAEHNGKTVSVRSVNGHADADTNSHSGEALRSKPLTAADTDFDDDALAAPAISVYGREKESLAANHETPPWDDIPFDESASSGALAPAVKKPQPKSEGAKIVDGIVVLPGQDQAPAKPMAPLPSIELLNVPNRKQNPISEEELDQVARLVEVKLADFNITANVVGVYPGPVVTRFELELAPGVKASKISNLASDLARSLLAERVRVVEVIPGKAYVGLELPNKFRETVYMRDVLDSDKFKQNPSTLAMVLGQDIAGEPVVVDLGKMPHLLVAGTTGSGKSVGVNVMITSLLYKSGPDDVRFIMIDPKMLELSVYEGIPHLLCEVVTDMKEASNALRWCVGEMERRYKLMSALGVRNLKGYNAKIAEAKQAGEAIKDPLWKSSESFDEEAPDLDKLPSIVVVVDEFADMMMIVGKKVEELIARIAQKARAAGIHLILATQRPSVDVITGLIKANIPTRMAFQVSSRIDSRTILDQQGAETLLGMGDMLYLPPGTGVPMRVHGAFIDDHEVHRVVADWHARGKPQYIEEILQGSSEGEQVLLPGEVSEDGDEDYDPLYDEAVAFVTESRRGSISSVQRKFKIGYNRAARIIEQMEMAGVVSAQGHNGNREVLAPPPPRN
ncbi:DNA translocase FtsK 4TM domain-containing protein [Shewanella sp. 3B26]|uniref:DNA translocase FtsK n=1 Tax=Shewanella zhuhaiensis TaxID=2919576 RepID=A0AAJ1BIC1_9GAMM|nr:DNA translocase FtsK [Shewanella zhuhaiensis]MCH4294437.1 DNA translocase FtsK 4TM domain-containing protein [Shewanella zhuhaiensis]